MVIKGDALVQVMGDWAKGEFRAAKKEAGQGLPLLSLPRHRRFGDLQHRHVRDVQCLGGPQGGAARARRRDDELGASSRRSTSSRARFPRAWTFRTPTSTCAARRASPTSRRPTTRARFVGSMAQNYAQPPALAGAYHDVVTKFFHGEIKTSDVAVAELDQGAERGEVERATPPPPQAGEGLRREARPRGQSARAGNDDGNRAESPAQRRRAAASPAGASAELRSASWFWRRPSSSFWSSSTASTCGRCFSPSPTRRPSPTSISSASPITRNCGPGPLKPTRRRTGTRRSSTWACSAASISSFALFSA